MGSYIEIFLYLLEFNNHESNYVDYILIFYIHLFLVVIDRLNKIPKGIIYSNLIVLINDKI